MGDRAELRVRLLALALIEHFAGTDDVVTPDLVFLDETSPQTYTYTSGGKKVDFGFPNDFQSKKQCTKTQSRREKSCIYHQDI